MVIPEAPAFQVQKPLTGTIQRRARNAADSALAQAGFALIARAWPAFASLREIGLSARAPSPRRLATRLCAGTAAQLNRLNCQNGVSSFAAAGARVLPWDEGAVAGTPSTIAGLP